MNKKAFALIFSLVVVVVLTVLGAAMLSRSISESRIAQRQLESAQAFWVAEAGVNRALDELRNNYNQAGIDLWSANLTTGGYSIDVAYSNEETPDINGPDRLITASGFSPVTTPTMTHTIQVVINKTIPPGFYENTIYSGGNVTLSGSAFTITAEDNDPLEEAILYAGELATTYEEGITGVTEKDSSISPLARLDFEYLLTESQAQTDVYPDSGNIYDVDANGKLVDPVTQDEKLLPDSFWYTTADDGVDNDGDGETDEEDEWVFNICYINGDLKLSGDIGTVGGFFVVAGDVITSPDETYDATITGNGQIEGVVYTRGTFRINGGGDADLNLNGGVWAGEEVRFNGGVNAAYNAEYMGAIETLDIAGTAQVTSWKDLQNPYNL